MPKVTNYLREAYKGGLQNWAIAQDSYHRLYVANNEGLLIYDGTRWLKHPVPNGTIVRSIRFGADGILYAGAQNELGRFQPDARGILRYVSLKDKLPKEVLNFADVWDIEVVGEVIFFRTDRAIFAYRDGTFTAHRTPNVWLSIFVHQGALLAQDSERGILRFDNNNWKSYIPKEKLPPSFVITEAMLHQGDSTTLLSTVRSGLFTLSRTTMTPLSVPGAPLKTHFTTLTAGKEGSFYVGTYTNGIYHLSSNGTLLEHINEKYGLTNNTVRCLYEDANGTLWAGLDNGISSIALTNGISHINPPAFNNGAGYSAHLLNNQFYFALSTGLQRITFDKSTDLPRLSSLMTELNDGQTWQVSSVGGRILVGKDDGFWEVTSNTPKNLDTKTGYWVCRRLGDSDTLVVGNYTGIVFFRISPTGISYLSSFAGFSESSRYLETEGADVWVSHPYRGLFRLDTRSRTVKRYGAQHGLPDDLENYVFKLKNKVVIATLKGIYEHDPKADRFVRSPQYREIFGELPLRYLKEDKLGNIWFVREKSLGVAGVNNKKPVLRYIPEINSKMLSGFEEIYAYDSRNVLVAAEKGFYHINYPNYLSHLRPFEAYLASVSAVGNTDTTFWGGFGSSPSVEKIGYAFNSLHLTFASTTLEPMEYSYQLDGFEKEWHHWTTRNEKDYTNLPEGTYTFRLKARRSPSDESAVSEFRFRIAPPWYRAWWAYGIYFLLAAALLFGLYRLLERRQQQRQEEAQRAQQQKFEIAQKQLRYEHQIALEKKAREVIQLQNERLQTDLERKNTDLATMATNLVQKKEFIQKMTEELNRLASADKGAISPPELKKLLRSLTSDEKLDKEWEQFSIHFDKVHSGFLLLLKETYPELNTHDLKLCAYLRMNLSSKEMAKLMSISVRGVEIGRYRLRKKLNLAPKEDLFQFLLNTELAQKAKESLTGQ